MSQNLLQTAADTIIPTFTQCNFKEATEEVQSRKFSPQLHNSVLHIIFHNVPHMQLEVYIQKGLLITFNLKARRLFADGSLYNGFETGGF